MAFFTDSISVVIDFILENEDMTETATYPSSFKAA